MLYCFHRALPGLGGQNGTVFTAFAELYLGVGALSGHSGMGYSCKFIEHPLIESFV